MLIGIRRPTSPPDAVELLLDCHARIRHFVAMARRLGEASGAAPGEIAETAARVHRYFTMALPLHVRDEEDSLAPRLRGREPGLDVAIDAMVSEHVAHRRALGALVAACAAIARDFARHESLASVVRQAADDLARQFEVHLSQEESVVLPAARRLLDPATDAEIVKEIRRRRDVTEAPRD